MQFIEASFTRPYYRRKLFFSTLVIVVLASLCAAAGLLAVFPSVSGACYGAVITTLHAFERMLVPTIATLFAVMTGLLALAVSFLHLFYSHRIAGPAFRLGQEAARIGSGDLRADFRLRRKDNLTDLEDSLKQVACRYRETVDALEQLTSVLDRQAASLDGSNRPAVEKAVREMTVAAAAMEKIVSEIRA
ncbi:MAG: hypothetical protein OEW15_04340 [Nitrospirota bacterium]|nr:hypothetical protein [Nitrospirota bacterium]